jgi:beta-galactosidase
MSGEVQERLVRYVAAGGRLLLNGLLPSRDHEGNRCTALADALAITVTGQVDDGMHYFPSVVPHGWAARSSIPLGAEVRTGYAQLLSAPAGQALLTEVGSGQPCAVAVAYGAGRAVVIACDYPCHLPFWHAALAAVGVRRRWAVHADVPGLVVTPTANSNGERLVHLVNVGPTPVSFTLAHDDAPLLDGQTLTMPARSVLTLPVGIAIDGGLLLASSAELVSRAAREITVRRSQVADVLVFDTEREVSTEHGTVSRFGRRSVVTLDAGERATLAVIRLG